MIADHLTAFVQLHRPRAVQAKNLADLIEADPGLPPMSRTESLQRAGQQLGMEYPIHIYAMVATVEARDYS